MTPAAFQPAKAGSDDGFVAVLDLSPASGFQLAYCTYLGGTGYEGIGTGHIDSNGVVTIAGTTLSTDFPTSVNAFDSTANGNTDTFVARLNRAATPQLVWSTYLGGGWNERLYDMIVDQGRVTIVGDTLSVDYPVTSNAFQPSITPQPLPLDACLTVFDPAASGSAQLIYSTYFGGTGDDAFTSVHADSNGVLTVTASTASTDLPGTAASWFAGGLDVAIVRLDPAVSGPAQLLWTRVLGGTGDDSPGSLSVSRSGLLTFTVSTNSPDFPTSDGAWSATPFGSNDVAVVRLDPQQSGVLLYSSYFGGSGSDGGGVAAIDGVDLWLAGTTTSSDLATTANALQSAYGGGYDAFVSRLALLPRGVTLVGPGTPGCHGDVEIDAAPVPRIGSPAFAIAARDTNPGTLGVLLLGLGHLPSPVIVHGVDLWIAPASVAGMEFVTSDSRGVAAASFAIPFLGALVGLQVDAQFVFPDWQLAPCNAFSLMSSAAVEVTIQLN